MFEGNETIPKRLLQHSQCRIQGKEKEKESVSDSESVEEDQKSETKSAKKIPRKNKENTLQIEFQPHWRAIGLEFQKLYIINYGLYPTLKDVQQHAKLLYHAARTILDDDTFEKFKKFCEKLQKSSFLQ